MLVAALALSSAVASIGTFTAVRSKFVGEGLGRLRDFFPFFLLSGGSNLGDLGGCWVVDMILV